MAKTGCPLFSRLSNICALIAQHSMVLDAHSGQSALIDLVASDRESNTNASSNGLFLSFFVKCVTLSWRLTLLRGFTTAQSPQKKKCSAV